MCEPRCRGHQPHPVLAWSVAVWVLPSSAAWGPRKPRGSRGVLEEVSCSVVSKLFRCTVVGPVGSPQAGCGRKRARWVATGSDVCRNDRQWTGRGDVWLGHYCMCVSELVLKVLEQSLATPLATAWGDAICHVGVVEDLFRQMFRARLVGCKPEGPRSVCTNARGTARG